MRKHLPVIVGAVIFATFFSAHSVFAAGWTELTSPTANNLNGVDCGSASTCIAVGDDGTVVYTTNKTSWSLGVSGVTEHLYDVDMASSTVGIAVGDSGTILKTTNGGATWTAQTSSTTEQLHDIFMATASIGWAAGEDGKVMKTSDGGTTWANVASGGMGDFRAVDATSTSTVWVAGKFGGVYRSTDGGTTWSNVSYATSETFYAIDALTSTSAIAAGTNGLLLKTTNSGATWNALTLPTGFSSADTVIDTQFWTSAAGTVVSNGGDIASTSNGGSTWTDDTSEFSSVVVLADAATPSVGVRYVVGEVGFMGFYDNYGPNAPTELTVDGDSTTADYATSTTPTLTWTAATDDEGTAIAYHEYSLDGSATWVSTGSSATSVTFGALSLGAHTVTLRAIDAAGNEGDSATLDFTVDFVVPEVGTVTPIVATTGTSTTFSVTATDTLSGVDNCTLYRAGTAVAVMTNTSGNTWSASVSTSTAGSYSLYAVCYDNAGNSATGASVTLTVTGTSTTTTTTTEEETTAEEDEAIDEAIAGSLIKLACDAGADVNDPCKAVYYLGNDGKRHAFPNEKVYFTWYTNFSNIIIVTDDYMASIMLGRNVTYHPGTKMVKFVTVNTVYAVGEDGKLRGIESEDIAANIYGSTWNKQIDDISDAFFGNYSFGEVIDSTSDFHPDTVEASVDSIDDIL